MFKKTSAKLKEIFEHRREKGHNNDEHLIIGKIIQINNQSHVPTGIFNAFIAYGMADCFNHKEKIFIEDEIKHSFHPSENDQQYEIIFKIRKMGFFKSLKYRIFPFYRLTEIIESNDHSTITIDMTIPNWFSQHDEVQMGTNCVSSLLKYQALRVYMSKGEYTASLA